MNGNGVKEPILVSLDRVQPCTGRLWRRDHGTDQAFLENRTWV